MHLVRRVASRAALLSRSPPVRRQAEAGWGAVKRSCRWEPGLHPHSPRFSSRCEPWAPNPTCALGWSCGHRCKLGAGSHRAGKREWENFLREARVGEGSGLSPSSPYLPLWGAGIATVPRWPGGHRQSLGGAVGARTRAARILICRQSASRTFARPPWARTAASWLSPPPSPPPARCSRNWDQLV